MEKPTNKLFKLLIFPALVVKYFWIGLKIPFQKFRKSTKLAPVKDEKYDTLQQQQKEVKELKTVQLAEERMRLKEQKNKAKTAKRNAKLQAKYQGMKKLNITEQDAAAQKSKIKQLYNYIGKNEDGIILKGRFYATSKIDVLSFLMSEGITVYTIEVDPLLGALNMQLWSNRIKNRDLIFFITQLSTYLKAGIPLTDSVRLLSKQAKTENLRILYQVLVYELTMGASFSEALKRQRGSFPKLFINMIKTAELTGGLVEVLEDMESYYITTDQTKRQMISALTYPAIIATFSVGIIIFIMVFVIPNFVSIYEGAGIKLSPMTVGIINLSNFMAANLMLIILILVSLVIGTIVAYQNVYLLRFGVQYISMHIPVLKDIIIYNEVTMFTKTFASLLHHDVFITDSMDILRNISNNEIYKIIIHRAIINLQKGENISLAFKNHWAFPTVAYEMLVTGEKTGDLASMMDKVADYYQRIHTNVVSQLKTFIEPILIVTLTLVVGGILLAVIVPMFGLYSDISTTG